MAHYLDIENLSKIYQTPAGAITALKEITLSIETCTTTMVVGHSGCGKTSLLKVIAGLEQPSSGQIKYHCPIKDNVGFVFQEARLMPWLSLEANIEFLCDHPHPQKTRDILELLQLKEFAHLYPHQLSGGMAQRAAIGRALYNDYDLILMDEPFASLDYFTRTYLHQEFLKIFKKLKKTILFVTHNLDEAIQLGDTIITLKNGQICDTIGSDSLIRCQDSATEVVRLKESMIQNLAKGEISL